MILDIANHNLERSRVYEDTCGLYNVLMDRLELLEQEGRACPRAGAQDFEATEIVIGKSFGL